MCLFSFLLLVLLPHERSSVASFVPIVSFSSYLYRHHHYQYRHHHHLPPRIIGIVTTGLHETKKEGIHNPDRSKHKNNITPLPNTDDPFLLLGLNTPTVDKDQIKRAYKRMALRYHPDVRITSSSSQEEKKQANDDFARINAAYDKLTGRNGSTTIHGSKATSKDTASSKYAATNQKEERTPPHRRSGYTPPSTVGSTNWEDFIPNRSEEEVYDAQGDSFGAIFTDLLSGLAGSAIGAVAGVQRKGGILQDLVDFLEQNFDYTVATSGSGSQESQENSMLNDLLQRGSIQDLSTEIDDVNLLLTQLGRKLDNVDMDIVMIQAELKREDMKYVELMDLKERFEELQARKKIVQGYVGKARRRLEKLQERYKDLLMQERYQRRTSATTDPVIGRSSSSTTMDSDVKQSTPGGTNQDSRSRSKESGSGSGSGYGSSQSSIPVENLGETNASSWRRESFGSFGRRGSSRGSPSKNRQRSDETSTKTVPANPSPMDSKFSNAPTSAPVNRVSNASGESSTSSIGTTLLPQQNVSSMPPHRRILSSGDSSREDKKRLRELKVDEEFDKLKKELGL